MRNLVIVAIWIGIGFAVTEFVASALEKSRVDEHQSAHTAYDPARDARGVTADAPPGP